jgi:hypothetical protein
MSGHAVPEPVSVAVPLPSPPDSLVSEVVVSYLGQHTARDAGATCECASPEKDPTAYEERSIPLGISVQISMCLSVELTACNSDRSDRNEVKRIYHARAA